MIGLGAQVIKRRQGHLPSSQPEVDSSGEARIDSNGRVGTDSASGPTTGVPGAGAFGPLPVCLPPFEDTTIYAPPPIWPSPPPQPVPSGRPNPPPFPPPSYAAHHSGGPAGSGGGVQTSLERLNDSVQWLWAVNCAVLALLGLAVFVWPSLCARASAGARLPLAEVFLGADISLSPGDEIPSVPVSEVNRSVFYEHMMSSKPLVIRGVGRQWGAWAWTNEHLRACCGEATVDAETSQMHQFAHFLPGFKKSKIKLARFLDEYETMGGGHMYLAEHPLIEGLSSEDIPQPSFADFMTPVQINWWLGAGVLKSLPHSDFQENILVQLEGVKSVRLVAPPQRALLYLGQDGTPAHYSPVDFHEPDLARFPRFAGAQVIPVELGPGDALFIPSYWFHAVRSVPLPLSPTTPMEEDSELADRSPIRNMAVNYWFPTSNVNFASFMNILEEGAI